MTEVRVYIPLRACDLTLSQVVEKVEALKKAHPDEEIFLDGDMYAIVGRKRI